MYSLCSQADEACSLIDRGSPAFSQANDIRNALWSFLNHYKSTLEEHKLSLPFSEQPTFR